MMTTTKGPEIMQLYGHAIRSIGLGRRRCKLYRIYIKPKKSVENTLITIKTENKKRIAIIKTFVMLKCHLML